MDEKFTEFEQTAAQREKDYKQIMEQQRIDSEQLKSFEKLKESNMELKSVRTSINIQSWIIFNQLFYFRKFKSFRKTIKFSTVQQRHQRREHFFMAKRINPQFLSVGPLNTVQKTFSNPETNVSPNYIQYFETFHWNIYNRKLNLFKF